MRRTFVSTLVCVVIGGGALTVSAMTLDGRQYAIKGSDVVSGSWSSPTNAYTSSRNDAVVTDIRFGRNGASSFELAGLGLDSDGTGADDSDLEGTYAPCAGNGHRVCLTFDDESVADILEQVSIALHDAFLLPGYSVTCRLASYTLVSTLKPSTSQRRGKLNVNLTGPSECDDMDTGEHWVGEATRILTARLSKRPV